MQDQTNIYTLDALCDAFQVSKSGYRAWLKRPKRVNVVDLATAQAFEQHKGRAGAPCLTQDVNEVLDKPVSQSTISRSLRKQNLRCTMKKQFRVTTDSNHNEIVAGNDLNRQFDAHQPNKVWVSDLTYLKTLQGWLYLVVIIDLFSRQVIGWQIGKRMDANLFCDALNAAMMTRGAPKGVMIHSDRGSQYCSKKFRKLVVQYGMTQSMSRKGNCWDNAVAESFFSTLKRTTFYTQPLQTDSQTKQAVFEFIEMYYNRVRRHSANNWVTPVEFERLHQQKLERFAV